MANGKDIVIEVKKWTIQAIGLALQRHIDLDDVQNEKIDKMYKILVTGNGEIPLPETVRKHDRSLHTIGTIAKTILLPLSLSFIVSVAAFIWLVIEHKITIGP